MKDKCIILLKRKCVHQSMCIGHITHKVKASLEWNKYFDLQCEVWSQQSLYNILFTEWWKSIILKFIICIMNNKPHVTQLRP